MQFKAVISILPMHHLSVKWSKDFANTYTLRPVLPVDTVQFIILFEKCLLIKSFKYEKGMRIKYIKGRE